MEGHEQCESPGGGPAVPAPGCPLGRPPAPAAAVGPSLPPSLPAPWVLWPGPDSESQLLHHLPQAPLSSGAGPKSHRLCLPHPNPVLMVETELGATTLGRSAGLPGEGHLGCRDCGL